MLHCIETPASITGPGTRRLYGKPFDHHVNLDKPTHVIFPRGCDGDKW